MSEIGDDMTLSMLFSESGHQIRQELKVFHCWPA